MNKQEIGKIADYLTDLEEGLYEWDYRGITTLRDLAELYRLIRLLMNETSRTKDEKLQTFLAFLNLKANKCKECIERRLAVRN